MGVGLLRWNVPLVERSADGVGVSPPMTSLSRRVTSRLSIFKVRPLALALAKTDMWEGHAGQTQAKSIRIQNPFGFHYWSVTVLSGIPGIW